jgi:predicted phage terminase large subunit-like protein
MNLPDLDEIDRELCRRSLVEFTRQSWSIVEPGRKYIHGWHIDAIAEHLEAVTRGEVRNLIINIPPRHMKSLLVCVFWFCWTWTFRPETRWIFASYSESLAIRDSLKCRRVIEHPWYQRLWGDNFQLASDQNQKRKFENTKTGHRLSTGVGGGATGEGGDFVVVDDPLKALDAHSKDIRETANDWWDNTMSTRGNDPNTVAKVVIMQRLHEEDLTGHLLLKMKTQGEHYEHLCLPAEYVPTSRITAIGWKDPRTEVGGLLWPERMDRKALDSLKSALSSYGAAGQLQQNPVPSDGNIFKKAWWRYWKPPGVTLPPVVVQTEGGFLEIDAVDLPDGFDEMMQSWDCAFKDAKDNDFVAGQVWGRKKANKYLLDFFKERADIIRTMSEIRKMSDKWPLTGVKLIEDKANGPAVMQMLRSDLPGLIGVEPEGGKIVRAHAVVYQIESGNVFLPHPALYGWVNPFITNCAGFPNVAHDDDVDSMTQALTRWGARPAASDLVAFVGGEERERVDWVMQSGLLAVDEEDEYFRRRGLSRNYSPGDNSLLSVGDDELI